MDKIHIKLDNLKTTQSFAQKLAKLLPIGTVIAMKGDLGTGKTTFSQAFGKGLGIKDDIGSPTFKLVSEYNGKDFRLYHIDCYRLENDKDFFNIGGEDYLDPTDGITIIEWADKLEKVLPMNCIHMEFKRIKDEPEKRELFITGLEL